MDTTDIKFLRAGIARQIKQPETLQMLRGKQIEAFRALLSARFTDEQLSHSYFKLPTGFGKTVMFATMARAYFDAIKASGIKHRPKIIIIVPRLSLINQTKEKLDKFADLVATEYSGRKKDNKSDIIITTYNSLDKLFGIIDFNDVGLIFADEAHHMLGEKISKRLTFYNTFVPIIGFTATPEYEANHAVANLLNTEIFVMNIPDSVKAGVLSPVKNVLYRSSIVCDLSKVSASTNGEFNYENITNKISPDTLATEIARIYTEGFDEDTGIKFSNLKAIINCPNAKIANLQAAKINEIIGHEVAVSLHKVGITNKQYNRLQQDFIHGKYTVACQVGTMTEGFDDVAVSMCINYPTRSRVKAEQTAGRAIRIDDNNPNKIAFVVDTIFRKTANEAIEDILYTASNAHQVLFKDIAGEMVLFAKYAPYYSPKHEKLTDKNHKTQFTDFELITDKTTLVELNNKLFERLENEFVDKKTSEWQSAIDLRKDETFPMGNKENIDNLLKKFQSKMPKFIQPKLSSNGQTSLCLHRDGRELFLEKAGIIKYPPKTSEWQSVEDLRTDKSFPMWNTQIITMTLTRFQNEMPGFIQKRKSVKGGLPGLCLHRDGRDLFLRKAIIEEYPPKTAEWQSATDLKKDKTFPMGDNQTIAMKLAQFQSEMPEFIQKRKPTDGTPSLCLHRDGRELFLEKNHISKYPLKTVEWQSALDLELDKTFPIGSKKTIIGKLKELQPEMPEFIQMRKPKKGAFCLCLHRDGRKIFLQKLGVTEYPPKTAEWQSANDLGKDSTFSINSINLIDKKLKELQSEMPDFIQKRKPNGGATGLCLHRNGREEFLRRVQESKTKSVRKVTKVISAGDEMAQTTKTIKSTMPKNISMKSL